MLPGLLGRDDRLAQRQHASILGEYEDVVLEDDGAHVGMRRRRCARSCVAFFGIEPRDADDAALRLVQKLVAEQKVQAIGQ